MTFIEGTPSELLKKIKLEDLEKAFSKALTEISGGNPSDISCDIGKVEVIESIVRGTTKIELVFSSHLPESF